MRLAIVVQRYGLEIAGGAELHARLIAERLARHHSMTVLTTCANDYVTWRNEYARGLSNVNGIPVYRFPVSRVRDPDRFGRLQRRVFHRAHSRRAAVAWMNAQGPYSPRLLRWARHYRDRFDLFVCFSYRYWTTYRVMRALPDQCVLVPTAEPDPSIELPIFGPNFRSARAIMYNSPEERAMIEQHAHSQDVPGVVVGVGIVDPPAVDAQRFRDAHGIDAPFLLYIGRIDANKGCEQLFDDYRAACARLRACGHEAPKLVLGGSTRIAVPEHPDIVYLGRVSDQDKYDAIAACTALVMPSFYESLSMVLLEAWALSRPVLVNAHCPVLQGQVARSNGGLFYHNGAELTECLRLLALEPRLGLELGRHGNAYYADNYTWPVIEDKYESMLRQLVGTPVRDVGHLP